LSEDIFPNLSFEHVKIKQWIKNEIRQIKQKHVGLIGQVFPQEKNI